MGGPGLDHRRRELGMIDGIGIHLCLKAECVPVLIGNAALSFFSAQPVAGIKLDAGKVCLNIHGPAAGLMIRAGCQSADARSMV